MYKPYQTVFSLAAMVLGLALAMDVYVPAVPAMAKLFHVNAGDMQLTLSMFMLTSGIVQLIVGPLADQYGRRPMGFISIAIFALGCVLCALASSVTLLILARMVQATGACAMLVLGFAIARDRHSGVELGKVTSFLNGMISFSPMFAPFIGSYLDIYFGWQATFYILLVIALLAFVSLYFYVPESLKKEYKIPLSFSLAHEYRAILLNQSFFNYTLVSAFGLSYLFIFCSISPYIIITLLKIPEAHYGYYFCFMGVSFFLGSMISGLIVEKIGLYKTVVYGLVIALIGGIWMSAWYYIYGLSIENFIWPMILIGIGGTFCMGAGTAGGMDPFPDRAGAAAALGGAFRFLYSALLGMLVIGDKVISTLPLAMPAIVQSVIGLLIFFVLRKPLHWVE